MIFELLRDYATREPDRLFLSDEHRQLTARAAFARVRRMAVSLASLTSRRIYFYAADSIELTLALIASQATGLQVCVLNHNFKVSEIQAILQRLGNEANGVLLTDAPSVSSDAGAVFPVAVHNFSSVVAAASNPSVTAPTEDEAPAVAAGAIIILTTGTTGLPKAAMHSWDRLLLRPIRQKAEVHHRWLLAYPLNHFAGIQVLLHVLQNQETLVIPASRDYSQIIATMIAQQVDSVSATPTFWRMIAGRISEEQRHQMDLRQITVGGEASTPDLLHRLHAKFPSASITQVYATTELGTCFSVKDGLPGFPASYLDRPVGNVQLKIIASELYIRSAVQMVSYVDGSPLPDAQGGWTATGDMVDQVGDRILFRGRKMEIINVGGVKVHPLKVEEIILRVPGVAAARAYGRPNPISGQIVACDLELEDGAQESGVREAVQKACLAELNRYEQPRQMNIVGRLDRQNEKLVRRV